MCKHSKNAGGLCDGSHRNLPEKDEAETKAADVDVVIQKKKTAAVIAARKPTQIDVVAGQTYLWCACGTSTTQPWTVDGACCKARGFEPRKFVCEKTETKSICMCKASKNDKGFCDGTHRSLPEEGTAPIGDIEDVLKKKAAPPPAQSGSQGLNARATKEEPSLAVIKALSRAPMTNHHGPMGSMGVPGPTLPKWDDIQIMVSQLANKPLPDDAKVRRTLSNLSFLFCCFLFSSFIFSSCTQCAAQQSKQKQAQTKTTTQQHQPQVGTELVIGPNAKKPLKLKIPLFVSDMSYGSLSENAKVALAKVSCCLASLSLFSSVFLFCLLVFCFLVLPSVC
jgi:CDGSH-type Zn-finger protein